MPGPNLELFRFGFYVFFPVYVMFKVGDPQWYQDHVIPYKDKIWPSDEDKYTPPRTQSDLQAELARIKAQRQMRRSTGTGVGTATSASSPRQQQVSDPTSSAQPSPASSAASHTGETAGTTFASAPATAAASAPALAPAYAGSRTGTGDTLKVYQTAPSSPSSAPPSWASGSERLV